MRESEAISPDLMAMRVPTWQRLTRNDPSGLFVLAVVTGAAAGYGALLFRLLTGAKPDREPACGRRQQHLPPRQEARLLGDALAARAEELGGS